MDVLDKNGLAHLISKIKSDYALKNGDIYEANLRWGGKNLYNNHSPIDAALVPELGANRFAFIPAANWTVEYSRDGGITWVDYEAEEWRKLGLTSTGTELVIGKADTTNKATDKYLLRLTLLTTGVLYTELNKFAIDVSTNGSTGCYMSLQTRTKQDLDSGTENWVTQVDKTTISGWSGWNVINTNNIITHGFYAFQHAQFRFIFGCAANNTDYAGLTIRRIKAFGGVGWNTPSEMARSGNIYTYNYLKDVIFPSAVFVTGELYAESNQVVATQNWVDNRSVVRVGTGYLSACQKITPEISVIDLSSNNKSAYLLDNSLASINPGSNGSYSFCANCWSGVHTSADRGTAFGFQCVSKASDSFVEGRYSVALGLYSHAEGLACITYASAAHAEGQYTLSAGESSHTEGYYNTTRGNYSHAGGHNCEITSAGEHSFVHGYSLKVSYPDQFVIGKYNKNNERVAFAVGNGASDTERRNAFEVLDSGDINMEYGDLSVGGEIYSTGVYVAGKAVITDATLLDAVKYYKHSLVIERSTASDGTHVILNIVTGNNTKIVTVQQFLMIMLNKFTVNTYWPCICVTGTTNLEAFNATNILNGYVRRTAVGATIFIDTIGQYAITKVTDVVTPITLY